MEHSYPLSRAGTDGGALGLLLKQMKSSAPPLRQGPPQEKKVIDGRGLSPGLSVKAAEVFFLLPSELGFRGVESPAFTRRHQGTFSKAMWGHPYRRGNCSEAA